MNYRVSKLISEILRWRVVFAVSALPVLVLGCNRDPNDVVVIESSRELVQARDQYAQSLHAANALDESEEAHAKYQAKLQYTIQKIADETSGSRQEASLILQRFNDQASAAKHDFMLAFEATLDDRILNPTLLTSSEEYRFQLATLRQYVDQSRVFYDSTLSNFASVQAELTVLPPDDYVTGLLKGLQAALQKQQPAFESFIDAHQEYGSQMLSLVEFLESRQGHWQTSESEIQFSSDDDKESFSKRMTALLEAEAEVNRQHVQQKDALEAQFNG